MGIRRAFQRPNYRDHLMRELSSDIELAVLRLLRAVQRFDEPPSVGFVARVLVIDPSTASRLVDSAARAALLERRPCSKDRRKTRLHLTKRGQEILEEVTARRRELLAGVTAQWNRHDLRTLVELLLRLQSGFDELGRAP